MSNKIRSLRKNVTNLQAQLAKAKFGYNTLRHETKKFQFYTGLDVARFDWLFANLVNMPQKTKAISQRDHLLLVLMRLRQGFMIKDLAYRFGIREATASLIFRSCIPQMARQMLKLLKWPSRAALRSNLPKCFRKHQSCVAIIDCTEIFIERPLNLNARAQTWSTYKNHNTIKYFIAVAPVGTVCFLSNGWGGRVSDKEITNKCGFLDKLQRGDLVLADRGFTVAEEFGARGAVLEIPSFTKGKQQLSHKEVDKSRQLANVRIHVERVIGRTRKFNLINSTIPLTQVDLLDDIMVVICGLVNISKSVV